MGTWRIIRSGSGIPCSMGAYNALAIGLPIGHKKKKKKTGQRVSLGAYNALAIGLPIGHMKKKKKTDLGAYKALAKGLPIGHPEETRGRRPATQCHAGNDLQDTAQITAKPCDRPLAILHAEFLPRVGQCELSQAPERQARPEGSQGDGDQVGDEGELFLDRGKINEAS